MAPTATVLLLCYIWVFLGLAQVIHPRYYTPLIYNGIATGFCFKSTTNAFRIFIATGSHWGELV